VAKRRRLGIALANFPERTLTYRNGGGCLGVVIIIGIAFVICRSRIGAEQRMIGADGRRLGAVPGASPSARFGS